MKILRVMYNYTLFGIASFVLITLLTHGDPWAYICAYWGAVTLKTLIEAILEATKEEGKDDDTEKAVTARRLRR